MNICCWIAWVDIAPAALFASSPPCFPIISFPHSLARAWPSPVLRATVGDTIVVHFLNNAAGTYSMHPHGLRYAPASSGSLDYFDYSNCAAVPSGGNCS